MHLFHLPMRVAGNLHRRVCTQIPLHRTAVSADIADNITGVLQQHCVHSAKSWCLNTVGDARSDHICMGEDSRSGAQDPESQQLRVPCSHR